MRRGRRRGGARAGGAGRGGASSSRRVIGGASCASLSTATPAPPNSAEQPWIAVRRREVVLRATWLAPLEAAEEMGNITINESGSRPAPCAADSAAARCCAGQLFASSASEPSCARGRASSALQRWRRRRGNIASADPPRGSLKGGLLGVLLLDQQLCPAHHPAAEAVVRGPRPRRLRRRRAFDPEVLAVVADVVLGVARDETPWGPTWRAKSS